mgnify:CR=1 FL=1
MINYLAGGLPEALFLFYDVKSKPELGVSPPFGGFKIDFLRQYPVIVLLLLVYDFTGVSRQRRRPTHGDDSIRRNRHLKVLERIRVSLDQGIVIARNIADADGVRVCKVSKRFTIGRDTALNIGGKTVSINFGIDFTGE